MTDVCFALTAPPSTLSAVVVYFVHTVFLFFPSPCVHSFVFWLLKWNREPVYKLVFKRELIKECLKVSTDSVCLLNVVGMQVKTVGTVCVTTAHGFAYYLFKAFYHWLSLQEVNNLKCKCLTVGPLVQPLVQNTLHKRLTYGTFLLNLPFVKDGHILHPHLFAIWVRGLIS